MDQPTSSDNEPRPQGSVSDNDLELLGRFRQRGDREALGRLFQRHAGAAYRIARRFLKDPHEAEDAVQAAFLNVMQHAHQFQGRSSVKTWLISTVVNVCRTKYRADQRRAAREDFAAESVTSESPPKISTTELYEAALNEIEGLPEEYRLPVWMHYCEGLAFSDIAEALVISEPVARKQTHRGLELLRGSLAMVGIATSAAALTASLVAASAEAAPATLSVALTKLAAAPFTSAAALTTKTVAVKSALALKTAAAVMAASATVFLVANLREKTPAPVVPVVNVAKAKPDDPPPQPAPAGPVTVAETSAPSEKLASTLKQEVSLWLNHAYVDEAIREIWLKLPRNMRLEFAATEQALFSDWRGFDLDTEKISVSAAVQKLAEKLQLKMAARGDRILFWREMPSNQREKFRQTVQDKAQPLSARREAALDLLRSGDVNAVGDVLLAVLRRDDQELNADLFQPLRRTLAFGLTEDPAVGTPYELLSVDEHLRTAGTAWIDAGLDAGAAYATPEMMRDFNARLAAILNLPDILLNLSRTETHGNETYFWALGYLNDPRCHDRLAEMMAPEGLDGPAAALALAARGDARALPVILRMLDANHDLLAERAVHRTRLYPQANVGEKLLELSLRHGGMRSEAAAIELGRLGDAALLERMRPKLSIHVPQDQAYRAVLTFAQTRDSAASKEFVAMIETPGLPEMNTIVRGMMDARDLDAVVPLIVIGMNPARHESIRRNALSIVCGMHSKAAIGQLLDAAPGAPDAVLKELFTALVHSHDPRAEGYVARAAAADETQPSRHAAVQALGHTRSEEGSAALFAALKDKDDIVRVFAHGSLERIDNEAAREYLCEAHLHRMPLLEIVANCCAFPGSDAEKRRAYNAHLREMAEKAGIIETGVLMHGLANDLGTQATQDLVVRMLDHPHEYVRKHALDILLNDERTFVGALRIVLEKPHADVALRKRAAPFYLYSQMLTRTFEDKIKRREALAILMRTASQDPVPVVRMAAVYSLHHDGNIPETKKALETMRAKETVTIVRTAFDAVLRGPLPVGDARENVEHSENMKVKQQETSTAEF